jgi:hypothetical protein
MRTIRLFVSSPGDVEIERQRVQWIAERLSGEFSAVLRFETFLWEGSVYNAHEGGFSAQIDERAKPSECDIVLSIFWGRLGTELHSDFPNRMPDGSPYPSGTAYELLTALEARKQSGKKPDVYVFRKNVAPTVPVNDKAARDEADSQWQRLEDFFSRHFELSDRRILRAVERFRDVSEFEQKVERLLRDWIRANVSQGAVWSIAEKGSPFRGLEPFDARHADVYCGRDRKVLRAIDELLNAAQRGCPFLLIPGASGAGKSSLMRAGMAPRLIRPGMVPSVDLWRIAVMRPATDGNPLAALAQALFVTGTDDDPGGFGKALPELANGAYKTADRLALLFGCGAEVAVDPVIAALDLVGDAERERRRFERPLRADLLLLVDQLEDIFSSGVSHEQRAQFAALLTALANTRRVWVVATLRGDMYESMITERPFIALKDAGGQYDLVPPGPDELDEIVHRSAEAAGLRYEERIVRDGAQIERRERLDDLLLRDAAGENTLPLLQFALNLLFERCCRQRQSTTLTIAAYEEIGGLDGAIDQTAELALARLVRPGGPVRFPLEKEVQEEISRRFDPVLEALLRKLVGPAGRDRHDADAAAARALTSRIVPVETVRRDATTARLVDELLHARILLATQSSQGASLRLAHDRVITSWKRVRSLTEKNRDFYRVRDGIEEARRRWEENDRSHEFLMPAGARVAQAEELVRRFADEFSDEARSFVVASSRRAKFRQRLMTAATLVFALVAVVASATSYYAIEKRDEAHRQGVRATENYRAARSTVAGLVSSIAENLKDIEGISVTAVEHALEAVDLAVRKLETENGEEDPELMRIRATMHYEFARVFQNKRELSRALEEAERGLNIRAALAAAPAASYEWQWDHSLSLEQAADIRRETARNQSRRLAALANAAGAADAESRAEEIRREMNREFDASRDLFSQAQEIRRRLHDADPKNPDWAFGLSQILVRIGDDREFPRKDLAGAEQNYRSALELMIGVVRSAPDRNPEADDWKVERELSWGFHKVGDILVGKREFDAALAMHENGLRARRYILSHRESNSLAKRDVAFSLDKIGRAKRAAGRLDEAGESLFESVVLRRELVKVDPDKLLWQIELAETLHLLGQTMSDARQFELAVGLFESAAEIATPISAHDARARSCCTTARGCCDEALGRIASAPASPAPDVESLKRKSAGAEQEAVARLERRKIDVETGWKSVMLGLPK